ncbi:Nicotinamide adenine dinucleotide transporter 1 [Ranunculus cassubicifolius]
MLMPLTLRPSLQCRRWCCRGVIAATFVCPLDVIKTRFQVHGLPKLANGNAQGSLIVRSLQQIFRKEGMRGMYGGLSPTILALLPNWAVVKTGAVQRRQIERH